MDPIDLKPIVEKIYSTADLVIKIDRSPDIGYVCCNFSITGKPPKSQLLAAITANNLEMMGLRSLINDLLNQSI